MFAGGQVARHANLAALDQHRGEGLGPLAPDGTIEVKRPLFVPEPLGYGDGEARDLIPALCGPEHRVLGDAARNGDILHQNASFSVQT